MKPLKPKKYSLFHQNVRGLRSKLDIFKLAILNEPADVFAFTETFLISSVNHAELFPSGYNVVRRDRVNDAGWGGVLLAVRSQYQVQQIVDIDGYTHDIEVVMAVL